MISKRELLEKLGRYLSYDQICTDVERKMIEAGGQGKNKINYTWPKREPLILENDKQKLIAELKTNGFKVSMYMDKYAPMDPLHFAEEIGISIEW